MHTKVCVKGISCKKEYVIDNVLCMPEILLIESSLLQTINVSNYPDLRDVPISTIKRNKCDMIIDMNQTILFHPGKVIKTESNVNTLLDIKTR